jgi:hypothetical protein
VSAPALRRYPSTWCYRLMPILGSLQRGDHEEAARSLATLHEIALCELAEREEALATGAPDPDPGPVIPSWRDVDREAPAALARAGELIAADALQDAILELEALALVRRPEAVKRRYKDLRPARRGEPLS